MPDAPDQNWMDRLASFVSPRWGAERAYYRAVASASYRGAVPTRLDTPWTSMTSMGIRGRERINRDSFRAMRDRARQLERDNVLAGAVLDRAEENVIGTGIRVRPMTSDPAFNQRAAAQWKRWTSGKTADIRHLHTFGKLQRLFYRGKLRDGDAGVLLTEERGANGVFHPRLQVIEGEHIDSPYGGSGDRNVIDGVELSANNAATYFHLRTENEDGREVPQRIKARDFVYLSRPALYSSVRGETAFNGGWVLFDEIVGYLESTAVTARVGACQSLFVIKNNPAQALAQLQHTAADVRGDTKKLWPVEPGMIHHLGPGEDVKGFNPQQPTQSFPDAIAAFARFVGLRFGLTLEQVLLDFSRTNYSSARAARLQAEQTAFQEQDDFAATFLGRVYPWAIAKWVKSGLLDGPLPEDWYAFEWIPQGKPWVDPTKEIDAAAKAIELGIDARSHVAAERGYDFRELCAVNAEDVQLLKSAGLPSTTTKAPIFALPAPEPETNNAP